MTSQWVTKVDTPCNNRRKRNLSLPSEVSSMNVKKLKGSDGLGRGSEDKSKRSDGASDHGFSDREVTDESMSAPVTLLKDLKGGVYRHRSRQPGKLLAQRLRFTLTPIQL